MKVVSVVGNRPQFIKAAPLARALAERVDHVLVHTGQHYDDNMSEVFFRELEIPKPDVNLEIGSGPRGEQTGRNRETEEHGEGHDQSCPTLRPLEQTARAPVR